MAHLLVIQYENEAIKEGKPLYVDFSAKFCMTCFANKKVAYSDDLLAAMQRAAVVLMRADKTKPNVAIDAELRKLKRSSIPVNALYMKGRNPAIKAELLSPSYMMEFLDKNLAAKKD